jgi:ATP-binding cassette subfamily B protein
VYYALGVLCLVLTNSVAVWIPREIERGIDLLQDAQINGPTTALNGPIRTILILGAVLIVIRTLSRILFFIPGRAIERDLRNDLFRWYLSRPIEWFQDRTSGDLIARSSYDVLAVRALMGYGFLQLTNMVILLALIISQMVALSPTVTIFAILPLGIGLAVLRFAIKKLFALNRDGMLRLADMEQKVLEGLKGVRVVRDFGARALVEGSFNQQNQELLDLRLKMSRLMAFYLPIIRLAGHLAIGTLLIFAATQARYLTVGEIAAYIAYLTMLVSILFSTGWMLNSFQRGLISLQRIDEVMPLTSTTRNLNGPMGRTTNLKKGHVSLRVSGLMFQRDNRNILNDINLEVDPGQHIGILGTVASGKSTLARILSGLEEIETGSVDWDHNLFRILSPPFGADGSLPCRIRLVPDVPFLFTRSIQDNVAFEDAPEDIDADRVREALRLACFDLNGEGLKDGVDTLVGEKGIALSGGQKQRITLARALYSQPDVLILDDVLSAVDHQTEQKILQRLSEWRRGEGKNGVLINISNRVSALAEADKVIVLHEGQIVERGTPEELAQSDGLYARTLLLQRATSAPADRGVSPS